MGRSGGKWEQSLRGNWAIDFSFTLVDHAGDSLGGGEEGGGTRDRVLEGIQHLEFHFTFTRLPQAWCSLPSRNLPEINLMCKFYNGPQSAQGGFLI